MHTEFIYSSFTVRTELIFEVFVDRKMKFWVNFDAFLQSLFHSKSWRYPYLINQELQKSEVSDSADCYI